MRGVVLIVVFVVALSMHAQRLRGWGFLILCFLVGCLGAFGAEWVIGQLRSVWNRLSNKQHVGVVCDAVAIVLAGSFIVNHGKRDEAFNDFVTCCCVFLALLLWGLYRLFSRVLDTVWARLSKR